jgi:acetyl/propionyl-CoA carboxylase alpha subunit
VRVDAGIDEGGVIPGEYDSMFAKLMVVADDRPAAIARLRRALAETRIAGVQTTLPFYRWLMEHAEFTDETGAGLSTDLIARTWNPAPVVAAAALRATELAAATSAATTAAGAPTTAEPRGPDEIHSDLTGNGSADEWWSTGVREAMEARG